MTHDTEARWLRSTFEAIAESAVVDEELGRTEAWRSLQRRTRRRAQTRAGAAAVVVLALVAVFSRVAGSGHSVKTVRPTPGSTSSSSPTSAPTSTLPSSIVATIDGVWPPDPIAYDGHAVWLARESLTSPPFVVVERRDPDSARLLARIEVRQEAVFSIAVDRAGSVWIAGGGDGGVPETTVSRIDAATHRVVFTRTLTTACSCQIVAGAGAVWLGANGGTELVRIDAATAAVAAVIRLPGPAAGLGVVGDRVDALLVDSRVAVIDPATNSVARVIAHPTQSPGLPFVVETARTTWILDRTGPTATRILVERR
jgi:hypothetical protein